MSGSLPRIGEPAPAFKAMAFVGDKFEEVSLDQYKGKYVVLFFYPGDFTFVCPTEIIAFNENIQEFKKLNCVVLGVSPDSHFTHRAWSQVDRKSGGIGPIEYPLLSDLTHKMSNAYGVYTSKGVPLRGLFIIDGKGMLRQITVNDFMTGRSVDETLRLIQALQFADENGEVCPANWKPGKLTIKPTPEQSKEYFQKANQ